MAYVDPNVAMYNIGATKDGTTSAFIVGRLSEVRVKVAKDHFDAKQASMIALANAQTTKIHAKLKEWDAAKKKSVERIRKRRCRRRS